MKNYFPAEWHLQDAVQLTWLNKGTDWKDNFQEAELCFIQIAKAILRFQHLIIVYDNNQNIRSHFNSDELQNIFFIATKINDTWARDHGAITVFENGEMKALDYTFTGWGGKFEAENDNKISRELLKNKLLKNLSTIDFVLEGGAIESNGKGLLLTTENCLLNKNRNSKYSKVEIEDKLKAELHVTDILWLKNGDLVGDDTDSHIDTLARFTSETTITYTKCYDPADIHFRALSKMEAELKNFAMQHNLNLVPHPLPTEIFDDGQRLPATYANFLIINKAVLLPIYDVKTDQIALDIMKKLFPSREVISINCREIIKQNGSLHCLTMQYPSGIINKNY